MINKLYEYAEKHCVDVVECTLPNDKLKGLYSDNVVYLKQNMTTAEHACILAEELGHFETSSGNILDYENVKNYKQEVQARNWAVNKLVTLDNLVSAFEGGVRDKYELIDYLNITADFLDYSITRLRQQYGVSASFNDYVICFYPNLTILRRI